MVPIWLHADQFVPSGENAALCNYFNKANLFELQWFEELWQKRTKQDWQVESIYITFCTEWAKTILLKGTEQQTQVNKRA